MADNAYQKMLEQTLALPQWRPPARPRMRPVYETLGRHTHGANTGPAAAQVPGSQLTLPKLQLPPPPLPSLSLLPEGWQPLSAQLANSTPALAPAPVPLAPAPVHIDVPSPALVPGPPAPAVAVTAPLPGPAAVIEVPASAATGRRALVIAMAMQVLVVVMFAFVGHSMLSLALMAVAALVLVDLAIIALGPMSRGGLLPAGIALAGAGVGAYVVLHAVHALTTVAFVGGMVIAPLAAVGIVLNRAAALVLRRAARTSATCAVARTTLGVQLMALLLLVPLGVHAMKTWAHQPDALFAMVIALLAVGNALWALREWRSLATGVR